jgi:hypothetical protein
VNILVAGGFDPEHPEQEQNIHDFCTALGSQIIAKGHVLLNGCQTQLDSMIAAAAYTTVVAQGASEPGKRVATCSRVTTQCTATERFFAHA